MDELKQLDEVAYIRFASVYRQFADAAAFREAIDTLERSPGSASNQLSLLPVSNATERTPERTNAPEPTKE